MMLVQMFVKYVTQMTLSLALKKTTISWYTSTVFQFRQFDRHFQREKDKGEFIDETMLPNPE